MSGGRNELRPRSRPASGMERLERERRDLAGGVNAGVGAPGAADRTRVSPVIVRTASSRQPCTVRSPGCCCQP